MTLVMPQIVVLDSSTLGKMASDYSSRIDGERSKSRETLKRLTDAGVYVAFTLTHIFELLRHENQDVVRNRLRFFRDMPLVAWVRPYDRTWFPGGIPDLLSRELHAVIHGKATNWQQVIAQVRPDLWETGVGADMFVDDEELWSAIAIEAKQQLQNEQYVASISRTDAGEVRDLPVATARQLRERPKEHRATYMKEFTRKMQLQLDYHGDSRLERSPQIAEQWTTKTVRDVAAMEAAGGDPIDRLFESYNVPKDFVTPDMKVSELGELAVYVKQLALLAERIRPKVSVGIRNIPPETLPSYVLERRLRAIQQGAIRVSGSDLGDGNIAPLVMYADSVEVDKRTFEFLNQIKRAHPTVGVLMGSFIRSGDYSQLPKRLAK